MKHFNPTFYEYQALSHISKYNDVMINIRIPNKKPVEEWTELDGFFKKKGKQIVIEVKNYSLSDLDIIKIKNKIDQVNSNNKFDDLIIIAPKFYLKNDYDFKFIEFEPDISHLVKFYQDYDPQLPEIFVTNLGWHHFRFQSIYGTKVFRSQVDKRINSIDKLKNEINKRLSWPPLKVYWSVMTFLNPKDLFQSESRMYPIKGPLFFDIDCKSIHYPCIIKNGLCKKGLKIAKNEIKKLVEILKENNYSEIYRIFSGRKGYHIYVFDTKSNGNLEERLLITRKLLTSRVKLDAKRSTDIKNSTTFPSTVNGVSLKEAKILH